MWQTLPSQISPYIFQTPWFSLHWYGFMYVVAYAVIGALMVYRLKTESWPITKQHVYDMLLWSIVGLAIGARLGYAVFYEPSVFLQNPLLIIWPFEQTGQGLVLSGLSGFSYHGGLLGIIVATLLYCRKHRVKPLDVADFAIPTIPLGYFFGRIGNFLNGELYGRPTDVPWAMMFPSDPLRLPRHPSQLYEAALEGLLLFLILWFLRKTRPFRGWVLPFYLVLYGVARVIGEQFRQPDPQLGFVFGPLTMGQLLSFAMIVAGAVLFAVLRKRCQ